MLERKPERRRHPPDALAREEPQVLRRRHQPPARAGKPRGQRAEIAGGDDDDAAGIEMPGAERERFAGDGRCSMTSSSTITSIAPSCARLASSATPESTRRPGLPAMRGSIFGELDAAHVVDALGLLQEEAVGTADVEQPPRWPKLADEFDRTGKLPPQDRLGAEIVGIAVVVAAGEIVRRVVALRIEVAGLGAAEPALRAAQDVAAVLGVEKLLDASPCRTPDRPVCGRGRRRGTFGLPLLVSAPRMPARAACRSPARGVAAVHVPLRLRPRGSQLFAVSTPPSLITFAHLSVSLATSLPKSAGVPRNDRCRRVRRAAPSSSGRRAPR